MANDASELPAGLLQGYPPLFRPRGPLEFLSNAGGFSGSRLWGFESAAGRLLVRRWPTGVAPERVQTIHSWLARLKPLPFIAQPVARLDGTTWFEQADVLYQVEPFLAGEAILEHPSAAQVEAAAHALAQVHAALSPLARCDNSPGLVARLDETRHLRQGELDRLVTFVRNRCSDAEVLLALQCLRRIAERVPALESNLTAAMNPLIIQPCLRDCRGEHFLFEGNRLTGLIDYGAMDYECPAADLARLFLTWIGEDQESRAFALRSYESVRPLEPESRECIGLFEESAKLLGPLRWIRWQFVEGRTFDSPDAVLNALRAGVRRL